MSIEEKRNARFYSGGQVVTFSRDIAGLGIAGQAEYRVTGLGRDEKGRQIVKLVDENGRTLQWDPRLVPASRVNVFKREERNLARGDRVQWRLVNRDLDIKNAERGTVEKLEGALATIRWDRGKRVQEVDLSRHKTWDHGYAETVYSAQAKTYDRVYVLAPVGSGLVNGQNYYTAITRARFGVRLWTENLAKLAEKLEQNSGEKTSSLEGLNRLDRDSAKVLADRYPEALRAARYEQDKQREERRGRASGRQLAGSANAPSGLVGYLADRALSMGQHLDRILAQAWERHSLDRSAPGPGRDHPLQPPLPLRESRGTPDPRSGPER
jgi:hypothetical protein